MTNTFSENFLEQLDWVGATNSRTFITEDIQISYYPESQEVAMFFRNDVHKLFTKTDRVEVAVFMDKILFREPVSSKGYKLTRANASTKTYNIRFKAAKLKADITEFTGQYELHCDKSYDIYYVDKSERIS